MYSIYWYTSVHIENGGVEFLFEWRREGTPQSTEGPYLDHGETTNGPIEKVYVTTLLTPMGLFKYVDGGNSKITPKK